VPVSWRGSVEVGGSFEIEVVEDHDAGVRSAGNNGARHVRRADAQVGRDTLKRSPFDKKEVRQAMNCALDRQRFVDTTLGGLVGRRAIFPGHRARLPVSPARTRHIRSI
jgi:hypothetical protein